MNEDCLYVCHGGKKVANPLRGCPMMFFAPSTAHGRGTMPSPAFAAATELILLRRSWSCCDGADPAATELILLRRSWSCAQRASLLEVPPFSSSRCCQQHLDEGRDDETTSSSWVL